MISVSRGGNLLTLFAVVGISATASAKAADTWAPIARLTSPHPAAGNHFGAAVSMSGTRLVVGEPYITIDGNVGAGDVYVYDLIGKQWQLTTDIVAVTGDVFPAAAHFGASVGVSGDRLIVGIPDEDCCQTLSHIGFTEFFTRNPMTGQWQDVGGHSGEEALEHSGTAVAIDGDIAITSSIPESGTSAFATLYQWNGSDGWSFVGEIVPSLFTTGMRFGASVAIMQQTNVAGGQLAVVGAPNYSPSGAANSGAVFTFNVQNSMWQAFRTLLDNPAKANDAFGTAVGVTQNRVMVGAPGRKSPSGTVGLGGVDAFTLAGSNFTLEDNLYPNQQSTNAKVGASLAVTPDPFFPVMVVGAPLGGATDIGSASLFKVVAGQGGDTWIEDDHITLGTDAVDNDQFGTSVAIAGTYAAVGVPLHEATPGLTDSGIVEIFVLDTIFTNGFETLP